MKTQTEALKLALEALKDTTDAMSGRIENEATALHNGLIAITAIKEALAQQSNEQVEPVAWVPYLSDRADGVKGHYAIARWNPRGYREVWNLRRHAWGAFSDDVMSLEEADTLMRLITIPTRKDAHPPVPTAQPKEPEQEPEFVTHNVDKPYDWSEWVCPNPSGYLMKCCDCGLVHEAEFGVVRYKSETERENCDMVDDPNLQTVFRMRRSEKWSPEDTAHRAGGLPMAQPEQEYKRGYADAMNWKVQNHLEHLPAAQLEQEPNHDKK